VLVCYHGSDDAALDDVLSCATEGGLFLAP